LIAIEGNLSVQIAAYKQVTELPQQAAAPRRFKTIAFAPDEDQSEQVKMELIATRAKLRAQFDKVTAILEQLADTTAAKR
jgi:hypothetical protein